MTLAFITGLTSEARLLRRLGHKVFVGGGTSPGATRGAEEAVGAGATSLISFGLAGGLDPALPSGSLIRPRRVLWRGQVFLTDTMFGVATCDALLAHDAIAATATEKQGFWADTGAAAIDMESGAVGEVAARHGLGFGVLRAICDPACGAGQSRSHRLFGCCCLGITPAGPDSCPSGPGRRRGTRPQSPDRPGDARLPGPHPSFVGLRTHVP
jgi:hypothetical protein